MRSKKVAQPGSLRPRIARATSPMLLEQHLGAPVTEVGEHDDDQLVQSFAGGRRG